MYNENKIMLKFLEQRTIRASLLVYSILKHNYKICFITINYQIYQIE